jgi:uncharacterized protein YwgA
MTDEWLALERAGEWAGLEGEELEDFVIQAMKLYNKRIQKEDPFEDFGEEYLTFLNESILSDPSVTEVLSNFEIPQEKFADFEAGTVPIEETFHTKNIINYSFDEIVDLVMLLKLIRDFNMRDKRGKVPSRYYLQKVVYLINFELAGEPQYSVSRSLTTDLALLEETGYRYSYRKKSSGPYSAELSAHRDCLVASGLLSETAIRGEGTGEISEQSHRFELELTETGDILMDRYSKLLSNPQTPLLKDWKRIQEKVLEKVLDLDTAEISNIINSETHVPEYENNKQLLTGRKNTFEEQSMTTESTSKGVSENA